MAHAIEHGSRDRRCSVRVEARRVNASMSDRRRVARRTAPEEAEVVEVEVVEGVEEAAVAGVEEEEAAAAAEAGAVRLQARVRSRRRFPAPSRVGARVCPDHVRPSLTGEAQRHPITEETGLDRILGSRHVRHRRSRHARVVERRARDAGSSTSASVMSLQPVDSHCRTSDRRTRRRAGFRQA